MPLDSYRLLGRSGLRVSPLCLGTMTFGTEWKWGSDEAEARRVFDTYVDAGGNFIDTANVYTGGTSETFVGRFMRKQRDRLIVATKYASCMTPGDPNSGGTHRKSLVQSLEASLRRLDTHYVDILWVHAWDSITPVDEIMRALDDVVRAGKVLYVGVSNAPAWEVARANALAELRGWASFAAVQVEYSLVERSIEREILPMCRETGVGVVPWSPLGGGYLTGKYARGGTSPADESRRRESNQLRVTEHNNAIVAAVEAVANESGYTPAQVALRWVFQRAGVTSVILGARTVAQLTDNLGTADTVLGERQMKTLDEASAITIGYPQDYLASKMMQRIIFGGARIETN